MNKSPTYTVTLVLSDSSSGKQWYESKIGYQESFTDPCDARYLFRDLQLRWNNSSFSSSVEGGCDDPEEFEEEFNINVEE